MYNEIPNRSTSVATSNAVTACHRGNLKHISVYPEAGKDSEVINLPDRRIALQRISTAVIHHIESL